MANKSKSFLDTSIFYELFKNDLDQFEKIIENYTDNRRYAAFFTAIELNRGFLLCLTEHYQDVEKYSDVPAAVIKLSNRIGRIPKYANILEAYMLRFKGVVSADPELYRASLEIVIMDMVDRANALVKRFIGHFDNHALAALYVYSSEDYDTFIAKCKLLKQVFLDDFWVDNEMQLLKIRERLIDKANPRLKKVELEFYNYIEDVLSGEYPRKFVHTADFVISLECPKDYKMVAYDHSFDLLIPLQGKYGGFTKLY